MIVGTIIGCRRIRYPARQCSAVADGHAPRPVARHEVAGLVEQHGIALELRVCLQGTTVRLSPLLRPDAIPRRLRCVFLEGIRANRRVGRLYQAPAPESPRQLMGKPTARAGLLHSAKSRVRRAEAWFGFERSFDPVALWVSPPTARAFPEVGVGSQPAQGDYCSDSSSIRARIRFETASIHYTAVERRLHVGGQEYAPV